MYMSHIFKKNHGTCNLSGTHKNEEYLIFNYIDKNKLSTEH